MRVEFNQGVPKGCIDWLWCNVGEGNIIHVATATHVRTKQRPSDVWYYERVNINGLFVPTITVYDETKATLFALRWR